MKLELNPEEDVRTKIKKYLEEEGRSIVWLASHLPMTDSHLRNILSLRKNLNPEDLKQINLVLGTDFGKEPSNVTEN